MKRLSKAVLLFAVYGFIYYGIEFLWKSYVSGGICHWSMFLLGGVCGIAIGGLNEYIPWEMAWPKQGLIGAIFITTLELLFGMILNVWFNLGVWDYSNLPYNLFGQICLPFSIAWFFLSLVTIVLDDYLRWIWFDEEFPHYHLHDKVCY